ncbi:MAG TPA: hypothetical protein VIR00_18450 [Micromonosporaceae bacterium]
MVDAMDECSGQATQRRPGRKNEHGGPTSEPMIVLEFRVGVHVAAKMDPAVAT